MRGLVKKFCFHEHMSYVEYFCAADAVKSHHLAFLKFCNIAIHYRF